MAKTTKMICLKLTFEKVMNRLKNYSISLTLFFLCLAVSIESADFVFGYGSLISKESRERSVISDQVFSVNIKGLERGWFAHSEKRKMAVLGVRENSPSWCNGVLIGVDADQLEKFDLREASYTRIKVQASRVTCLEDNSVSDADTIWAYVPKKIEFPTEEYPIYQTYVDVSLSGCLEYGESFASDFVTTTVFWEGPWIDDRDNPLFIRPMTTVAPREILDYFLEHVNGHRKPR